MSDAAAGAASMRARTAARATASLTCRNMYLSFEQHLAKEGISKTRKSTRKDHLHREYARRQRPKCPIMLIGKREQEHVKAINAGSALLTIAQYELKVAQSILT
eukprot:4054373-Pleurochrysis_carterae.AAC.2